MSLNQNRPKTAKNSQKSQKDLKMDCRERYKMMVQFKSDAQFNSQLKTLTEPDLEYQTIDEIDKKFNQYSEDFSELNQQPIRNIKRRQGRLDLKNNPYNNKRISNVRGTLVARNQEEFLKISQEFHKKLTFQQSPTKKPHANTHNNIITMSNISDTDNIQRMEILKESAKRLQNKHYRDLQSTESLEKVEREKKEKLEKLQQKKEKIDKKVNQSNLWIQTHDDIMQKVRNQDNKLLNEHSAKQQQIMQNNQHNNLHSSQIQNSQQTQHINIYQKNGNLNNQLFRLDDDTQINLFASHTVSVLFQALMVKSLEETFGIKYNIDSGVPVSESVLKSFGININFLKSIKSEKERKNYIQETMNARIDVMLKEWNQEIQHREKQYAQQEKERIRKQQQQDEGDQDFFKWLNVKTKQESLKKKLRSEIIKRMTDYDNYIVLVEKYQQQAKNGQISKKQLQKNLYLDGVPYTSTRTVISELNKVEGDILDKWEARKKKHLSYKKKNFYTKSENKNNLSNKQGNQNETDESKLQKNLELLEDHISDSEEDGDEKDQNASDQKNQKKIHWNNELENQFIKQKQKVQSLYYEDIMSTDWQELAYIPFVQQNNLDSHNQVKRDALMDKHRGGNVLTPQELKFMADTSKLLNSCLDKDFLKASLQVIEPECIHYMELDLAERIINNYNDMKQNIINARKQFLKKKINQVQQQNQQTVKKWEQEKIKQQNIQAYKKKTRLMNYELKRIYKERPILFAYYSNFFFKLAVNIFRDNVQKIRIRIVNELNKLKEQGVISEKFSNPYQTDMLSNSEKYEQQKEKMQQLSRQQYLKEQKDRNDAKIHRLHPPSKLPYYPKKEDGEIEDYYQMRIKNKVKYMEQKIEEFKLKGNSSEESKNQLYFSNYLSGGPIEPKGSKFEHKEDFKQLSQEDKKKLEHLIKSFKSYKMRYIVQQKKMKHNNQGYRECTKKLNLLKLHKYIDNAQQNFHQRTEQKKKQNSNCQSEIVGSHEQLYSNHNLSQQKEPNQHIKSQQPQQIRVETQEKVNPYFRINTSFSIDRFNKTTDSRQKLDTEEDMLCDIQNSYLNMAKETPNQKKISTQKKPGKQQHFYTQSNINIKTNSSYFLTPKDKCNVKLNFTKQQPSTSKKLTEKYQNLIVKISQEDKEVKRELFNSKKNSVNNPGKLTGDPKQKKLAQYKSPGQAFERLKLKHTCLFNAVKRKQLYLMQTSRFEYNRDDVRQIDDKFCTPLHYAVKNQDVDFCEWLLQKGADPNQLSQNSNTPLHIAFKENNIFIIGMLIDQGGDLNLLNQDGFTPCGMGTVETLNSLNLVDAVIMGKNQKNFDNNRLLKQKPNEEIKEQKLQINNFYPLKKNDYRDGQVDTIKINEYVSM